MTVTAAAATVATADSCLGDDQVWPPGFRFHPTDEELVLYYLKRKICKRKLKLDIIRETDVYKWDPQELPAQSILKTGDRQWFFFTPRERRYPNGARSNRGTIHGYWKATGKDRSVACNSRTVGVKKTLVFYRGRAPNGERTDWVMHEYTLDEEELKRCPNVKEYYALYKLYKKSGPGPKNGEQYGAPFKEDVWDDEYASNPLDAIIPCEPPKEVVPHDNVKANGQVQSYSNDIGEFMIQQPADEPALPQTQAPFGCVLPPVVGEEETLSTLLDPYPRDVLFPKPIAVLHNQESFEFSQSPTSQLQLQEVPEVTSVAEFFEEVPQIFGEDFLEIDDLLSSEPLTSNIENTVESNQFNEMDGLSEFDLFHDAAMFLQDLGPIDQGTVPFSYDNLINHGCYQSESQSNISLMDRQLHPQLNAFGDNQLSQSQLNAIGDNQQLQPQFNAFGDNMLNQVDYQFQFQFQSVGNQLDQQQLEMDPINGSLWTHDQSGDVFIPSRSNLVNASPASGSEYEGTYHGQGDKNGGGASRISSALWSFVESIPTTPASASENPLVNRAFERMSSFRLRFNARNTDVSAVNGAGTARRAGRNKGFFFISILGALCAVLWLFIGTVRVLGRSISS
ncbi:hypothetical protein PTKIN_Ptkin09bG0069700 [Pterospermum kingtungense]